MRAIRLHEHSGIDGIRVDDAPRPRAGAGQVLIEVKAAGVNPVDWKIAEGLGKDEFGHELPVTLGADVSGVVAEVGDGVNDLKAGDEVFGYLSLARCGAFAEHAIAEPNELAAKPPGLSHAQAAAIPVAALTAWQAMFDKAKLTTGQTVLIHAASGGVGHFAVQLARHRGARVIGTASGANEDFVRGLGADEFINYRDTNFEDVVSRVDLVLDSIGGETQERSFRTLKSGGWLISIVGPPSDQLAEKHAVRATYMMVQPNGRQLAEIAQLAASDRLRVTVAETIPLENGIDALHQSKRGRTRGKLVLEP